MVAVGFIYLWMCLTVWVFGLFGFFLQFLVNRRENKQMKLLYIYNWYSGCRVCIFILIYSSIACQQEHCMNNTSPMCLYRQMYNVENVYIDFYIIVSYYNLFLHWIKHTMPQNRYYIITYPWRVMVCVRVCLRLEATFDLTVFCPCVTVKHWLPFTASEPIWQFHHLLARRHRTHLFFWQVLGAT